MLFCLHYIYCNRIQQYTGGVFIESSLFTEPDSNKQVQPDPTMKNYWRNNRRFADLINGSLFHGDPVIHAEDLVPCDTEESTITENRTGKSVTIQRSRDILKMYGADSGFTLIGLERQSVPV